jgi:hypothetical protein
VLNSNILTAAVARDHGIVGQLGLSVYSHGCLCTYVQKFSFSICTTVLMTAALRSKVSQVPAALREYRSNGSSFGDGNKINKLSRAIEFIC